MPRSLGRASLLLLGSTWTHSALGMLVSVMVARVLGPDAVGALALNLGLAGLAMAALAPGFTQAHNKRLAEGHEPGRCIGTMLLVQAVLAAMLLVALLVAWRVDALARIPAGAVVFLAMLAAQLGTRLADVFLRVFLVREWVVMHGTIVLATRVSRVLATGAVLAIAPRLEWVALTFPVEAALTVVVASAALAVQGIRPRVPTRASVLSYWRYARPLMITTPIALAQDSIDRVLVGRWAGLAAAGYYHVARGLWEVLGGVMGQAGLFLFSRLSALYTERTTERDREARAFFFGGLDKLLFVTTALAVATWAFARLLIALLYGVSFEPATTTVRILVVAALAATLVNPYTFILQAQDQVARFIPLNMLRFVVYLVALLVLVPGVTVWPSGAEGAALARLLLIVFPAWVWVGWTRELAGIPFYRPAVVYLAGFAMAVLTFEAAVAVLEWTAAPSLASEVGAAAAAFAVYALWLAKRHPDTRANLKYAVGILVPGVARRPG
jgi:O-antigen/teichoic acid export membrane protein